MQKIRRRLANCSRPSGRQPETPCCRLCINEQRQRQAVSDGRAKCLPTGMSALGNTYKWSKVMRCSVMESLVCQHGHLVHYALWNSQPVEADESIGDVVTETKVIDEPFNVD